MNSLPTSDGRVAGWAICGDLVNAGYGTLESKYYQSLAVMDTATGKVMDFPDVRTPILGKQSLFSGLAFSADGKHLYASMASLKDPEGDGKTGIGNGIAVYSFDEGKIAAERLIPIPLQKLARGRKTALVQGGDGFTPVASESDMGVPYPAAIAVVPSNCAGRHPCEEDMPLILVADNLSDDVLLIEAVSGRIATRFDVSEEATRCHRLIRWRWRYRRMGRAGSLRFGMRAR